MYDGYKELNVWKESMKLVFEIYRLSRNYDKVFIQFLNTAQGSAAELETQLIIAAELKFATEGSIEELLKTVIRIKKMIRSLIQSI